MSHKHGPDAMLHAPWPFDLADLAGALLLPGHMGPSIVPEWTLLVEAQGAAATTPEMRSRFRSELPLSLSELQQLAFKSLVDATPLEMHVLNTSRGSAVNPVVQYFERKRRLFPAQTAVPLDVPPRAASPELSSRPSSSPPSSSSPKPQTESDGWSILDMAGLSRDVDMLAALRLSAVVSDAGTDHAVVIGSEDGTMSLSFTFEEAEDLDDVFAHDVEHITANCVCCGDLPSLTDSESEGEDNLDSDSDERVSGTSIDAIDLAHMVNDFIQEPLSLLQDSRGTAKRLPTILYKATHKPVFHTWTPLKLSVVTAAPSSTYRPARSAMSVPCDDALRRKKTLRSIKETSKLYIVGPMDFCSNTKAVRKGRGW
ncbi:hypothetical protein K438DRAFT_1958283 [Mycena galopus ATCC 62051]|nr:hypothetical protein K438DRAFT_1958283 [Mycena galopus ATCC 62051]